MGLTDIWARGPKFQIELALWAGTAWKLSGRWVKP